MSNQLIDQLLVTDKETGAQIQLRLCLSAIFKDQDPLTTIVVAGQLIEYARDVILPSLGTVRRNAAGVARASVPAGMGLSPDQIATATGLSRATVSRLITEDRNPVSGVPVPELNQV